MFNLEKEIRLWKKSLRKNRALEDGYIEELESHLRDEIEARIGGGSGKEKAFMEALEKIGTVDNVGSEYYKSDTTHINARPPWKTPMWIPEMMYNYFKVAVRNVKRQLGFSIINISGLAVGIACVIFVILFVSHLFSYDKYHQDYQRVYRVGLNVTSNNSTTGFAMNVPPLGPALKSQYPQVEESARIFYWNSRRTVKHNDKLFYENGFVYADNEIFDILSYKFIHGDQQTALVKPFSLVIPERISSKIFGTVNSLNNTLNVDGMDYTITGVIEDAPANTHIPVDIFVAMEDLNNPFWLGSWDWPGMYTFLKVKEGIDVVDFEKSVEGIIGENLISNPASAQSEYEIFLQPISDIYLNSELEYEVNVANPQLPLLLITIGVFILVIACFNYINLSTVKMIKRFKEIGMRKILGASRTQLFFQFINESLLITILSFILALILLNFVLPLLNELAEVEYQFTMLLEWGIIFSVIGLLAVIVIISGIYPAVLLSSFSLSKAVASKSFVFKGNKVRRALVIGQFAMSIGLIFGALVASSQIDYLKTMGLGFNKESKIIIPLHGRTSLPQDFTSIKDDLQKIPGVSNAAVSSLVPGQGAGTLTTKSLDGNNPIEQMMYYYFIDSDFLTFYDIKFASGRNFYPQSSKDYAESCIINESAAQKFGWTNESAIGKQIVTGLRSTTKTVVGVTKDFHYRGLQFQVDPLIIELDPTMFTAISLTANHDQLSKIVNQTEKVIQSRFPGKPFEYFFLDEYWNDLYESEERTGNILNIFTLLSILIASLGLFGLVSFIAETRTKEIGVRKVLGCSTTGIVFFMINRFIKWIVIANIIALPLAYLTMKNWLYDFPYRTEIEVWMIMLTLFISICLAVITVLYQSIKSATTNPINSLRYE